ncbi:MAG: hypothetical protein HQK55_02035 [Deltaproteobacteria bacterium]|nr:hypothetical protein [Deltaproteobacteria bacterium]
MSDPYLPESVTIKARPWKASKIQSLLFEHALPNEYIVEIGKIDPKPRLGGKYFKIGRRFLKFPAAVQTVYFTSDNANKNYQGLKIDGYAFWRVDPEKPEVAARSLDFSDQDNPMGNTNRILRTICTEAIRHIIANISIEEALTKKDEIGRDLKAQLQRIERIWGITFDQVGIERVKILSSRVFDDLQQKTRDSLRLAAEESRMRTDQEIEKKKTEYLEEMERLHCQTEKEAKILRATTESEIHKVELEEISKREVEERNKAEERKKQEAEAAERAAQRQAELAGKQATRETELELHKESEKRRQAALSASLDAEARIKAHQLDARITEEIVQSELKKAELENQKRLKEQELAAALRYRILEVEHHVAAENQLAELRIAENHHVVTLKKRRELDELEHETETKKLERLRTEEQLRNSISSNRVMERLVDKLPELASSIRIDRYTVLDGTGASPISHVLAQILSVLDERGLGKFLKNESGE